ncbi:MAG: twin-arginine translocase subunit TatC [Coriobacteriales bacterium]|jgi:sec-independent protein translocase protein TatC|nr:twin-arginine translocase subunit TatC [Coriobacteriales bacterium]
MPVGQARMPLFDHIGELRRRLTVVVVALLVATCILYLVSDQLIYFLVRPILEYILGSIDAAEAITNSVQLKESGALSVLDVFGAFALRFKVALVFGIFVTCPIWVWQFLGFFMPALNPNERKWVIPTFFAAIALFVFGMTFCYLVILDPAFEWMLGQSTFAAIFPDAVKYINTILLFEVGFGVAFELPLVVFYLTVFNIIPYKKLRASWRTVYIVLMVICAMVTPDANPITMLLMFAAMAVLYEGSLLVSRLVLSRRLAKEKKETGDEDEEDEDEDEDDNDSGNVHNKGDKQEDAEK